MTLNEREFLNECDELVAIQEEIEAYFAEVYGIPLTEDYLEEDWRTSVANAAGKLSNRVKSFGRRVIRGIGNKTGKNSIDYTNDGKVVRTKNTQELLASGGRGDTRGEEGGYDTRLGSVERHVNNGGRITSGISSDERDATKTLGQ